MQPGRILPARGTQQAGDVDEIAEHLAVIGGRPLVVTAIGQHLDGDLPAQPAEHAGEQSVVGEEHRQASQCLQVLDEVIAAHVRFQVAAQEARVRGELAAEQSLDRAAGSQGAVDPAEGPGPQRRGVRMPR